MVLDSQSVLLSSDVLSPEEGSVSSHSVLDLESDSIVEWVSWEVNSSSVDPPGLVETIVTVPVDDMSVVGVAVAMNIKALLTIVIDSRVVRMVELRSNSA